MASAETATAAPHELILDGKKYRGKPMTDADYSEFVQWVKDRYRDESREELKNWSGPEHDGARAHPERLRLPGALAEREPGAHDRAPANVSSALLRERSLP